MKFQVNIMFVIYSWYQPLTVCSQWPITFNNQHSIAQIKCVLTPIIYCKGRKWNYYSSNWKQMFCCKNDIQNKFWLSNLIPNIIFAVNILSIPLPSVVKTINIWFPMEVTLDGIEFPVRGGSVNILSLSLGPSYIFK